MQLWRTALCCIFAIKTDPQIIFSHFHFCSQDPAPKGKMDIPGESCIAPSADRPHCWRLSTPAVPSGLLIRADSAKDKRRWLFAMRTAINSQVSEAYATIRDGKNEDQLRESGIDVMDLM